MASADMEHRVRKKLGMSPEQEVEWNYKPADFSPAVRVLVRDGDESLGILGAGRSGDVC